MVRLLYVLRARGLRRCSSIYGVGIFVSSSFVQRFFQSQLQDDKDKSLRLSCVLVSNSFEP